MSLSRVFGHPHEESEALESTLERLVAEGERACAFRVAREDFVRHVAARVEGPAALAELRAGDLYLACGCALGVPDARRSHCGDGGERALGS